MNLKPHYLSCFHEFFKTRILLFLGLSTQGPLNLVLHDAPRPPLFHKITTPRPHTHKKRSQMIPSSIRKNVQQNKYKFLFHVFFKKAASLMLLLYYYYTLYQYRKWNYFFSSLPVKHNLLRALSTFAYFSICKTANLLDTMCLLKS